MIKFLKPILVVLILIGANFVFANWINDYVTQVVCVIGVNIILALSLNLINGQTGQFSLGHAGFMAIGAYVSAAITVYIGPKVSLLFPGIPAPVLETVLFLTALFCGGLAAALAGLMVGIPTLRLKGDYLAIATLGFAEIVRVMILNLDVVGGARGFSNIPEEANLFWIFLFVVITAVVIRRLVDSIKGSAWLAVRDDEVAAEAVGIGVARAKVVSFAISSFFAGLGGGLFAHLMTYLNTNSFGFLKSVEIVVMVVLGGLGSMTGSVLAAIVLTLLPELLRSAAEARMVIYALLLIIMMIVRPQGLMGNREWKIFK